MCGITGYIDLTGNSTPEVLSNMVEVLNHRGPNDAGIRKIKSKYAVVGLGQTRLSIIDLSNAGHQPMKYKHFTIVFNGEIYNYQEIKDELIKQGHQFETKTDTEVILHAFETWGTNCVQHFIGMFSFVIYDQKEEELYGFRDRTGVKPFFYYEHDGLFLFASELKSFHQHPYFKKDINKNSLASYFDLGYIPAPSSIFNHTYKLEAGHFIKFSLETKELEITQYWDALSYYSKPKLIIDYKDAKSELRNLLKSAFDYRMVADVNVGVFLSGGYDSSAVAAILQHNSSSTLKTFTIGFDEGNNEAPFAKETASYLGTEHHELICTAKEAQSIIPTLPYFYDEPFADSSSIPTILVSEFAKKHVTVALSADGGDEVFGGYDSYGSIQKKTAILNKVPTNVKPVLAKSLRLLSNNIPDTFAVTKHKIHGISKALNKDALKQAKGLINAMSSLPVMYQQNVFNINVRSVDALEEIDESVFSNEVELAMCMDYKKYLPDDILTKVDRATMSVGLEGREPLLDHRIIEFVAQLPLEYKFDGSTSKRILKEVVHEYIPKNMMDRPKAGFSLPIYNWLRGDLAYLIDEYLNEERLKTSGLFNISFVLKQIALFKRNQLHYQPFIWKLLMFQMWWDKWMVK
jgi:asparagine synthase (glutamine-hydrolysing)